MILYSYSNIPWWNDFLPTFASHKKVFLIAISATKHLISERNLSIIHLSKRENTMYGCWAVGVQMMKETYSKMIIRSAIQILRSHLHNATNAMNCKFSKEITTNQPPHTTDFTTYSEKPKFMLSFDKRWNLLFCSFHCNKIGSNIDI